MNDIKKFDAIAKKEPIDKGWSGDKKFRVETADGQRMLLRISDISKYDRRKSEYDIMKRIAALGVPMCEPIEFGTCDDGVYSLQSWIDGKDLPDVLFDLSEAEQYELGVKSGEILRKIHTIPAPETQEEWAVVFNGYTDAIIQKYKECGVRFAGDDYVLAYIEQNRRLLENRPQCLKHGDYFMNNMMLEHGELKVIDFESYSFGDPWIEFFHVRLGAVNPYFLTGQLRGYFNGEPPMEFFKLYAFYNVSCLLPVICHAVSHGQDETDKVMKQSQDILEWFDNMSNPVPSWYLKELWDVLDENGNQTGRLHERGKPMKQDDYHLVVHVWVINGSGEFLISKRTPNKIFPDMWECTGGSAVAGDDSLTSALKEVKEELGIALDPENGQLFRRYKRNFFESGDFVDVWLFRQEINSADIVLQPDETCDAMLADKEVINQMITDGNFIGRELFPYIDELFEFCDERRAKNEQAKNDIV